MELPGAKTPNGYKHTFASAPVSSQGPSPQLYQILRKLLPNA